MSRQHWKSNVLTPLYCRVNKFLRILTLQYLAFKIKTKWVILFLSYTWVMGKTIPWQKLALSLIHSESHWIGELIWGLMVLNCLQLFFEHQSRVWTCSRNIVMCSLNPSNVSAEHTFSLYLQATFQRRVAMKLSFGQWKVSWIYLVTEPGFLLCKISFLYFSDTCIKFLHSC